MRAGLSLPESNRLRSFAEDRIITLARRKQRNTKEGKQMEENFVNKLSKIINDLDESQLKVEKHAFDVINSSDTSLNLVREGISNIEDIVREINSLNAIVEESSQNIKKLEDMSALIEDFAKVIGKIASKTNMLSLNASIEAARAGEQGRGFAVVAKEVGSLAAKSTQSSNDITKTVWEVHGFVDAMITSMNEIRERSLKQQEKASAIGDLLKKVLDAALIANDESRGMEHEIAFQRDITDNAKETLAAYGR